MTRRASARSVGPLAVCALVLVACPEPIPSRVVPIGLDTDMTGANSEPGWADSARLAVKLANQALLQARYKDMRFDLKQGDNRFDPNVAVERALSLVHDDHVVGIALDISSVSLYVNKLAYDNDTTNDLNVPLVCAACTSDSLNNPAATSADPVEQAAYRNEQKWLFRGIMGTKAVSLIIVRDILHLGTSAADLNHDNHYKISYYGTSDTAGVSTGTDLKAHLTRLQTSPAPFWESISFSPSTNANTYNFAPDLDKLTNNHDDTQNVQDVVPDALVMLGPVDLSTAAYRTYKTAGFDAKVGRFVMFQAFRGASTLDKLGALAEGAEGASHVLLDDAVSGAQFVSDLEASYGKSVGYRDSIFFDAMNSLLLATVLATRELEDPSTVTGEQVKVALQHINEPNGEVVRTGVDEFVRAISLIRAGTLINYMGASGPLGFDANQRVRQRLAHYQVQNGKFVDVKKFDCVADSTNCPAIE